MYEECIYLFHFSTDRLRPYHVECTGSRPITEVKQRRAWLVLGWETAWEHQVLQPFWPRNKIILIRELTLVIEVVFLQYLPQYWSDFKTFYIVRFYGSRRVCGVNFIQIGRKKNFSFFDHAKRGLTLVIKRVFLPKIAQNWSDPKFYCRIKFCGTNYVYNVNFS